VTVAALTYGVLAIVNMAWPRTPDAPWYDNYIVLLSAVVGTVLGAAYLFLARPDQRSSAPAGDAIPAPSAGRPTREVPS
jgi:hypothetical protein